MKKSNEQLFVEAQKICAKIFEIHPTVRFAAIYGKSGRKIAGGMRSGLPSFLNQDQTKESIQRELKRWKLFQTFHEQLGQTQYSLVKYDKVILITIVFSTNKLFLVSLDSVADINNTMNHIRYILSKE